MNICAFEVETLLRALHSLAQICKSNSLHRIKQLKLLGLIFWIESFGCGAWWLLIRALSYIVVGV